MPVQQNAELLFYPYLVKIYSKEHSDLFLSRIFSLRDKHSQ